MSTSAIVNSSKVVVVNDPLTAPEGQRVVSFDRQYFDGEIPAYMKAQYHLWKYETIGGSKAITYTFQRLEDMKPLKTADPAAQAARESRRIAGPGNGDKPPRAQSLTQLIPTPEPDWFIEYRKRVFERDGKANTEIERLRREIKDLQEKNKMQNNDNLALTMYGEKKELEVVRERVSLTTYGANLDKAGCSMVAQLCWLMDWNPFFDVHAFETGGRVVVMPDYKKVLEIVREKERINYESRPMTPAERTAYGLDDKQVGFITEITEVDTFLEFVKAGVGDQYHRIKGAGVWSPGDQIAKTWTKEMVAEKRSLRKALAHLTSYKIASKRLQQALMQAGALMVEETEDGFVFDAPKPTSEPEPIVVIDQPAAPPVITVEPPPTPEPPAASSPEGTESGQKADSTPAPEAKPVSELDKHFGERESAAPARCANCGIDPADPSSPFPTLCKSCGDAEATRQVAKEASKS
jgi:hypothetical protein